MLWNFVQTNSATVTPTPPVLPHKGDYYSGSFPIWVWIWVYFIFHPEKLWETVEM